jgi:hypothetical protein
LNFFAANQVLQRKPKVTGTRASFSRLSASLLDENNNVNHTLVFPSSS